MVDLARDSLLKVNEVAKRFRVHRRTVEAWMTRGLECVMVGRVLYTSEEALQRFAQPRRLAVEQSTITATVEDERRINDAVKEFGLSL